MDTIALLQRYAKNLMTQTSSAYSINKWNALPIQENEEPLVQVPVDFCLPYYHQAMNLAGGDGRLFVRKTVLEKLLLAEAVLRSYGLDLKLYDGWRPLGLQENLFWYYLKMFTVAKFGLNDKFQDAINPCDVKQIFLALPKDTQDKLKAANCLYVSWPSQNFSAPSPHATGGAVDVWPYGEDNEQIDLGVPFDWMEKEAGAFYHLGEGRHAFKDDAMVCWHRNLLLFAMTQAGFSCYPEEIWHYNFGNQMHALVSGQKAVYSYIELN